MAKRKSYSDEQRADLVVMLESEGFPTKPGALRRVSEYSGVPESTLSRWFHKVSNPPPSNLVSKKRGDLSDIIEEEVYNIFDLLPDKRDEATYRELTTSAAILIDKMRLLRGLPTEIVQLMPAVVEAIKAMDQDPVEIFQKMIDRAAQRQNVDR